MWMLGPQLFHAVFLPQTSLLKFVYHKMSLRLIAQEDWFLNISERNASALTSNSSNKIFWHRVVKCCWVQSPLTLVSDRIIKVSLVVHFCMQCRNHSKQRVALFYTIGSQVRVSVTKSARSSPHRFHTRNFQPNAMPIAFPLKPVWLVLGQNTGSNCIDGRRMSWPFSSCLGWLLGCFLACAMREANKPRHPLYHAKEVYSRVFRV